MGVKDERLRAALDARLPDQEARARMWAAIESGMAAELAAAEAAGEEAQAAADEAPAETPAEAPAFTVVRGGNAGADAGTPAKRRTKRFSWQIPAAAAVLAIAIGAGVLYVTHNPADPGGPGIDIPDDPTPGHSGTDTPDGPGTGSEVARTQIAYGGESYTCASDEPVDAAVVGERLGEAEARVDGVGEARTVEVFAAKGRYATGSYLVAELDGACYLFLKA